MNWSWFSQPWAHPSSSTLVQWVTTLYLHPFNSPHYQYLLISNDRNISFVLTHHSQKIFFLFCHITRKNLEYFFKNTLRVRVVDKYQSHLFLSCNISQVVVFKLKFLKEQLNKHEYVKMCWLFENIDNTVHSSHL